MCVSLTPSRVVTVPFRLQAREPHAVALVLGTDRVHATDHDVDWTSDVQAREDCNFYRPSRVGRFERQQQGEEGLKDRTMRR